MPDTYTQWVGRTIQVEELLEPSACQAMDAALDGIQNSIGAPESIPHLWHWLHFLDKPLHSKLAVDGHEKRGEFLPPVDLPRRMWAAGNVQFHKPLKIGSNAKRESRIDSIQPKQGKTGELVFVNVHHDIFDESELAISEQQTIVYREAAATSAPITGQAVSDKPDFEKQVVPDVALLFRYSALTYNAHRIHYDREYACEEEGYSGLVVHGPLLATLLMGTAQEQYPSDRVAEFQFKAVKPVFDLAPFNLCGQHADSKGRIALWVADDQNELCMQASAQLVN